MSGLSGEFYTELYRAVHRALSAIRNNGVSAFQGKHYTGNIGPIVGFRKCPHNRGVRFSGLSARRGSTVCICDTDHMVFPSCSILYLCEETLVTRPH